MPIDTSHTEVDALPAFANAENKAIDAEIRNYEVKLSSLAATFEDHASRANAMKDHMKNVQQEVSHTHGLCDARNREINTEEHLKQLAERERGRLIAEIRKNEKEMSEITDQLNIIQNDIYRNVEKIDAQRADLNLEKGELEEWLRVQSEKDEDNITLLKYTKEDEMKIKTLSLQIEKLLNEVNKKKNALSAEVTETQVSQIELDKTTEAFRALHVERQNLLASWEAAIKTMKERDQDIVDRQNTYHCLQEDIRKKEAIINEKQRYLGSQLANNSDIEKKIQACDRAVGTHRLDYQQQQTAMLAFHDEVDVLRNTLNKTATDLVNKKIEIGNLKTELQDKRLKLVDEKNNKEKMKEKLDKANDTTQSLEAKAQQLADMLREEETRSKSIDRELKVIKDLRFKQSQEAFRLKQDEENLKAEVAGGESALKGLKSKIAKYDNEALKQQALLYNQDFQIQHLERKVRRAQGERSEEEKEILVKKIDDLTTHLEEQTRKWGRLNTQLKRSQDDIRQSKQRLESLTREKENVTQCIGELNMYNASAAHQLLSKVKEKEELMVEENILRLELRKLRGFLNARADEVYSLENRQVQLGLALEERTREMEIHKEMLRIHIKNADEERYSAASELRDRIARVEKLKKRYEIIMTQFGSDDGEQEHTQAYFVIKAAQQREELQREGDELDAKIQKSEKEMKALENTLRMLNSRNEDFRNSLHKADLDSKDAQHRDNLEQQFRSAMEKYKSKRKEIRDLQEELTHLEKSLAAVLAKEQHYLQGVGQLEGRLTQLDKELGDQQVKRERAWKQVSKLSKDLRKESGFPQDVLLPGEFDIQIKETCEISKIVLNRIMEISEKNPDMSQKISMLFSQAGIAPPSRPTTRASHRRRELGDDSSSYSGSSSVSATSSRKGSAAGSIGSRFSSRPASRTGREPGGSRVSTTNIDVILPPTPRTGAGFSGVKSAHGGSTTPRNASGSTRVKKLARPGSATSNSSHGSDALIVE